MKTQHNFNYLFGPVRSGRLGLSLGVDLLGKSICSLDCLYCEVGRTAAKTLQRKPYVQASVIEEELRQWFARSFPRPDYITLGGSGEPCLNSELKTIIQSIRGMIPDIPVAILTNSTLVGDQDVNEALYLCDVVLPSLDTLVQEEFARLNQPCGSLDVQEVAENLIQWSQNFTGKIFLEILLIQGINDSEANLERLKDFCRRFLPDRIDVVTMTRPGAYSKARPVDDAALAYWREELHASSPALSFRKREGTRVTDPEQVRALILASLKRRPQTEEQLAMAIGLDRPAVTHCLHNLIKENTIQSIETDGKKFFSLKNIG